CRRRAPRGATLPTRGEPALRNRRIGAFVDAGSWGGLLGAEGDRGALTGREEGGDGRDDAGDEERGGDGGQERGPRALGLGHRAEAVGEHAPHEPSEQRAERQADQQPDRDQRARLPKQREPHLTTHEPERLEQRELVTPATYRREQRVRERRRRE